MSEWVYDAFISYSHKDMEWATWIQRKLEAYRLPKDLRPAGKAWKPLRIFRDQTDLAGAELESSLRRELTASRCLIVICSPNSASSRWVQAEIETFLSLGRRSQVIPLIVSGEPFSDRPELECFPPALRKTGGDEDEFLGANVQEIGKGKAFLKVVSMLLDIRFNRLVDREKQRKRRMMLTFGSLAAVALLVTGGLLYRNYQISERNHQLTYDAYTSALVTMEAMSDAFVSVVQPGDAITPEEFQLLRSSAEAGNRQAMLYLADCYKNGWGTGASPEKAFTWFQKLAEMEDPVGLTALGNCYLNGEGTAQDPALGFQYTLQGAEAGNPNAMCNLAQLYEGGLGVEQDPEKALYWFDRAAQTGNERGLYNLARCYMGAVGTEQRPELAFEGMKKLAERGNPDGMYNLGLMYQFAFGTAEDPALAYFWYRKAAEAGDPAGMEMTGWCIENGYGAPDQALEWYRRSAEGYRQAAEAGDEKAAEKLETLEEKIRALEAADAAGAKEAEPGTEAGKGAGPGLPESAESETEAAEPN